MGERRELNIYDVTTDFKWIDYFPVSPCSIPKFVIAPPYRSRTLSLLVRKGGAESSNRRIGILLTEKRLLRRNADKERDVNQRPITYSRWETVRQAF